MTIDDLSQINSTHIATILIGVAFLSTLVGIIFYMLGKQSKK